MRETVGKIEFWGVPVKNSKTTMAEKIKDKTAIRRRDFIKASAGIGAAAAALPAGVLAAEKQTVKAQSWWDAKPANARANRSVAIDVHAHWVPEPYAKAMAALGHPLHPDLREMDLEKRRQWMDEHGVQMCVLTLNGGMPWQLVSPEEGVRLAQIVNDAAVEAHTAFPDRFTAAVEIPMIDPVLGLKELNRVAGKPGLRGIHLPDSVARREYVFEPAFAPILARSEELGYPLLFHNLNGEVNVFGSWPAGPGLDAAFSHAVEATKFITSGTLDKYPKLDIVLPHAGGAFPFVAGRTEHSMYHMPDLGAPPKLASPFRDYLRRFHYDYLTYHPEGLRFLIDLVGADRILVGTDSFNAKDIEYPSAVVEQFNFPAADRDRILKGNATRLFRL
jgi:aminocarboxymuconate-semialdehyde decarboxylase